VGNAMRTTAAVSRVAPSITAPRTLRARNHDALTSPKCAATLSWPASTRTESAGTAPSIVRKRRSVSSRPRVDPAWGRAPAGQAYAAVRQPGAGARLGGGYGLGLTPIA